MKNRESRSAREDRGAGKHHKRGKGTAGFGGEGRTRGAGRKHKGGGRRTRMLDYGELRLMTLSLIAEKSRHGYEIIRQIEEKTQGAYVPSPGVIYPTIAWLEDMGYIETSPTEGRKKLVQITESGIAFLSANQTAATEIWTRKPPKGKGQAPRPIVDAMDGLKHALRMSIEADDSDASVQRVAAKITQLAEELKSSAANLTANSNSFQRRVKHETRRRTLFVKSIEDLGAHMRRFVLESDDLHDFVSLGADDHIKLFLPTGADAPVMRDFTPRGYSNENCTITLDFALHQTGPATDWAQNAKIGDPLEIGGPRGSHVIDPVFDWWLLIGDETALPAIGRRVEELPAGTKVITLATVVEAADEQRFETAADLKSLWIHRPIEKASEINPLLDAAKNMPLPEGNGFVWIAAEAQVARRLKDHFLKERGHPISQIKASGYWIAGQIGQSDKTLG